MLKAAIIGARDGWEQGPNLNIGMSYTSDRHQRVYDAMTYVGCGLAVLAGRGWMGGLQ